MAGITFTEASGVNDSIYGKSQYPIKAFLESKGEAYEQESIVSKLFVPMTSTQFGEKFTTLTAMDGFKPVGENGAYPVDHMEEGYSKTVEHTVFKDSFSISREMIDDSKLMDLKAKPAGFIKGYYRTREQFGAALFGAALGLNGTVGFRGKKFDTKTADGKTLFAKDHPSKVRGAAQSNLFADAFNDEALAALETSMQNFKGDNGEILDVTPDTIIIPNDYALKKAVFAAIGADKDPNTANNGFNFLFGRWNVIVWNYLNEYVTAGAKPWILMDSRYNQENIGAAWIDRVSLDVRSSIDENTDANVWRGYARWSATFNDWRFAAVGGVSGGDSLL